MAIVSEKNYSSYSVAVNSVKESTITSGRSYSTTTTKRRTRSQNIQTFSAADPYGLVVAKTTTGKKAQYNTSLGRFESVNT